MVERVPLFRDKAVGIYKQNEALTLTMTGLQKCCEVEI